MTNQKIKIPYEDLKAVNSRYLQQLSSSASSVINGGWYVLGDEVDSFEKEFANYVGVKYAVGVASGLDALIISLKSAGIGNGDEVIVPANTYIATILAVIHCGATPIMVDAALETYNLDPLLIEESLTEKTKAVLVTHLYGIPCDIMQVSKICKKFNLLLFEDCAQSIGTFVESKHTGAFGAAGCFSFYPTKTIGAIGDAGLIATNDESLFKEARALRNYGSNKKYVFSKIGFNSRLDEIQAKMLRIKLKYIQDELDHRISISRIYRTHIKNSSILPPDDSWYTNSYHIFPILTKDRERLRNYLLENGIGTEVHYPIPPYSQEALAYNKDNWGNFPISDYLHKSELSLPISSAINSENAKLVASCINDYFDTIY